MTAVPAPEEAVSLPDGGPTLAVSLMLPPAPIGVVLFAPGGGSARQNPRNPLVAMALTGAGLATVLADLLTIEETGIDGRTAGLRFDVGLLGDRVAGLVDWLGVDLRTAGLPVGLFGTGTGAAAALVAAAHRADAVKAVVCRGGRPDLAAAELPRVWAPTLFIVGGRDFEVQDLCRAAAARLGAEQQLVEVPGATRSFEEPGALEQASDLARDWYLDHLG